MAGVSPASRFVDCPICAKSVPVYRYARFFYFIFVSVCVATCCLQPLRTDGCGRFVLIFWVRCLTRKLGGMFGGEGGAERRFGALFTPTSRHLADTPIGNSPQDQRPHRRTHWSGSVCAVKRDHKRCNSGGGGGGGSSASNHRSRHTTAPS